MLLIRTRRSFFNDIFAQIVKKYDKVCVVGDYNDVLDPSVDPIVKDAPLPLSTAAKRLKQIMAENCLQDVWRVRNPDVHRMSWYRGKKKSTIQGSRLDYAIISDGLSDMVHNTFYMNGIHSDHSAFFIGFELQYHERGKGYWKFNTSYLTDICFLDMLRKEIKCIIMATRNPEDKCERWETIKNHIQKACQTYARNKCAEDKLVISQLHEHLIDMEDRINQLNDEELALLYNMKEEFELLIDKQTRSAMFRSKAKFAMEGEKNTKYFMNLEKMKYNAKMCHSLFDGDRLVTDPKGVLDVQKDFYQCLYTADPKISFQLEDQVEYKCPEGFAASSEHQLTIQEFAVATKSMKNNSCPGKDGIPAEIYKIYWKELSEPMYEGLITLFSNGILYQSARQGIISVIPKGSKDTRYVKNLRPITLLNCDYKILEKVIANRMIPALQEIIHKDQKGFLPNRKIAANIRRVLDVVEMCEEEEYDSFVLSCDYLKCFDMIEYEGIRQAMQYFGFSTVLQKWIAVIYTQFQLKVQNNGNFSNSFVASRGVHQGGPCSNAIFLCVAELLAISLRNDNNISGIYVRHIMNFLNQYADDMDLMLHNSQKNLDNVLKKISEFHQSTGFTLSYDKTSIYWVGAMRKANAKLYTPSKMNWTDQINVLGVDIRTDKDQLISDNYASLIVKSEEILDSWSHRNVSLLGKVTIINTLVASLFVYKMSVLPKIPTWLCRKLDDISEKFLWSGRRPKIPIKVLQRNKSESGVKLVNFAHKDCLLKASWVKSVLEGQYPEEIVYSALSTKLPDNRLLWSCNLSSSDAKLLFKESFWRDVLESWCTYHYSCTDITMDQIVWCNSKIRSAKLPIAWAAPMAKGLLYVSQLISADGYLPEEEVCEEFSLTTLQYNTLKSAIPRETKEYLIGVGGQCHFTLPQVLKIHGSRENS